MIIEELKLNDFDRAYINLLNLQYENSSLHFPNKNIDIERTKKTINEIKEYMSIDKAFVFVAKIDDEIIGFIWCYPRTFYDESRIYINSLIVQEKYRNQKIGQKLMEKVIEKGKELNCDAIDVSTAAFNDKALKFYHRLGFLDERVQLVKKINF